MKSYAPTEALRRIQECVKRRDILWTYHVFMRMQGRCIPRSTILDSVDSYEIIESYPEDKYMASYLVRAECGADVVHVLFAFDIADKFVRIITTYRPDAALWSEDGRKRR